MTIRKQTSHLNQLLVVFATILTAILAGIGIGEKKVAAYTMTDDGYALVTNGNDFNQAVTTDKKPYVRAANDLYYGGATTVNANLTLDMAGYTFYESSTTSAPLYVTGAYSITVMNMNQVIKTAGVTTGAENCKAADGITSTTGYAHGYYGFIWVASGNAVVTYQNCIWQFAATVTNTQPFYSVGPNAFQFSGTNTFTCGTDQELQEGDGFTILDGTTSFIEQAGLGTYNSCDDTGASWNLTVNAGATLNWTSNRTGFLMYTTSPVTWTINGNLNLTNTAAACNDLWYGSSSTATITVGSSGSLNVNTYAPLFDTDISTVTFSAASGSYIDIRNNLATGQLVSGVVATSDTFSITNPSYARFAAGAGAVFGTSTNFKMTATNAHRLNVYSDMAQASNTLSKRGVATGVFSNDYVTLFDTATPSTYTTTDMSAIKAGKVIEFSAAKGLSITTLPTALTWQASLNDINALASNGETITIARTAGNIMPIAIYDDRDIGAYGWSLSVASNSLVPLVYNGNVIDATGQTLFDSSSALLTQTGDALFQTTFAENAGIQAQVSNKMKAGTFTGTLTWTINDTIS
ncbi:hypothetical protein Hs20B_10510 [Lactococcus insecticola]|uniref:WxL domain-containing protein n=2 Tax=Pseudolactococcus insecticola TaxID=2709158 RepID=A0A6A0B7L9_9LACT|nr:hypothetical protein Hs20B_10510 [Lactococcus insecticola]